MFSVGFTTFWFVTNSCADSKRNYFGSDRRHFFFCRCQKLRHFLSQNLDFYTRDTDSSPHQFTSQNPPLSAIFCECLCSRQGPKLVLNLLRAQLLNTESLRVFYWKRTEGRIDFFCNSHYTHRYISRKVLNLIRKVH